MEKKILIDATHEEEVRMAIVENGRVEEFDVESHKRRHVKGNIYLARVVRVEPSLQAAFVDYGVERHGFLPFGEIHPDYYQIPVANRPAVPETAEVAQGDASPDPAGGDGSISEEEEAEIETIDNDAPLPHAPSSVKGYRIQEVIRRGQILLIQVSKEERGNKGAALTTYVSLAGRYCILLPNILSGGGISRKIKSDEERERIKKIVDALNVPTGMGVVVRTIGENKTKQEIKKDYDSLTKLWEGLKEKIMISIAPVLIYDDGNLIKRTIRDSFDKNVTEVIVDGEEAYKEARQVMRTFISSQVKMVHTHSGESSLFQTYNIEEQLESLFDPIVPLWSGGYIVINRTEALIAIDVNSGKSTKERNIEVTALKTNLEAAEEITRQLKLRDLSGLIVIDFIDMEEGRHNRAVEARLRECLKADRAHIQIGRISPLGLLEMSRQRLRAMVTDNLTQVCPQCAGAGLVRSPESRALRALRAMGEISVQSSGKNKIFTLLLPLEALLVLFNQKRTYVTGLEQKYEVTWLLKELTSKDVPYRIENELGQLVAPTFGSPKNVHKPASRQSQRGADRRVEESAPTSPHHHTHVGDGAGRRRNRLGRRRRGRQEKRDMSNNALVEEKRGGETSERGAIAPPPQQPDTPPSTPKKTSRRWMFKKLLKKESKETPPVADNAS